jgi:DedD protein
MSYLHDDIDDGQPRSAYQSSARELTLSTGTILGIFFGLVLLCAVFFGFGYNMGSKSRQAPVIEANGAAPVTTDFNAFKPAPGSPANPAAPKPSPTTAAPVTTVATQSDPAPIVRSTPAASTTPATSAPTKPHDATETPVAPPHSAPANEAGLTFIVQVAAVSHQDDADLLVAALKRKGYSVNERTEPQDKLFHIQVGPFATKKDAEAMRQRLLADGYNAILK